MAPCLTDFGDTVLSIWKRPVPLWNEHVSVETHCFAEIISFIYSLVTTTLSNKEINKISEHHNEYKANEAGRKMPWVVRINFG